MHLQHANAIRLPFVCRWDMSGQRWSGTDFPWDILSDTPSAVTHESVVSFSKPAAAVHMDGVSWTGEPVNGPFAARASAQICSVARSWQQLQLLATPGTQMRIDGITAAVSAERASASTYPRGSARYALHVHWMPPGCHGIEIFFFEPPACGHNHVEALATKAGILAELGEVRIAYSNTSAVLCADASCASTRQLTVPPTARGLSWSLVITTDTVLQSVQMLDKDMTALEGASQVRRQRHSSAVAAICTHFVSASVSASSRLQGTKLPAHVTCTKAPRSMH